MKRLEKGTPVLEIHFKIMHSYVAKTYHEATYNNCLSSNAPKIATIERIRISGFYMLVSGFFMLVLKVLIRRTIEERTHRRTSAHTQFRSLAGLH